MNKNDNQHAGWVILAVHDSDDQSRIGYGQGLTEAKETQESFAGFINRTLFVKKDMKEGDIPFEKRVKWRSFSDDGDAAYSGVINIDWIFAPDDWDDEEDQDLAYNLDQFNMTDWGAVIVLYNAADIRRCRPDLTEYVAKHSRMERKEWLREAKVKADDWLGIYG